MTVDEFLRQMHALGLQEWTLLPSTQYAFRLLGRDKTLPHTHPRHYIGWEGMNLAVAASEITLLVLVGREKPE